MLAISIVLTTIIALPISASAADLTEGDYRYTVSNNEATITKYSGQGGDVIIPSTLGGHPVTHIGSYAFECCEALTSVNIPDNVRNIDLGAFSKCTNLTSVNIPISVTSIGSYAFFRSNLKDVYYAGTEEDWNNIAIGDENEHARTLARVNIHFIIHVTIDGEPIVFPDQQPIMMNDRTFVPVRAIFEALGATVEWDEATQTAKAVRGNDVVTLTIGEPQIFTNGTARKMDVSAIELNGRIMIPARFAAEAFGCNVDWDESTQTVLISK